MSFRQCALGWAVIAGIVVSSKPARAQEADPIDVTVEGCALRSDELVRLVKLELTSVLEASQAPGAYSVTIQCEGGNIRMLLHDPLTSKNVDRTVVAPPPTQPEPERLLALTVAQLYRASWLELAVDEPAPLPPSIPPVQTPRVITAAKRLAVKRLRAEPPPPPPKKYASIAVSAGVRARRLDAPLLLPSVMLEGTWLPTGNLVWLLAASGVEWASVDRAPGTLNTLLVRAGLGLGVEPLTAGAWSGFAEIVAGLGVVRIAGENAPGYRTDVAVGVGFEGSAGLGVAARVGTVRFELIGRVGLMHGTPAALVAGDAELSLDGASAGTDFRVRWMP